MGGGNSNKPIVFVFGAKKGDADGRKKNLSAINTQVAYRAHERRREKKSRQRSQAKDDEKLESLAGSSQGTNAAPASQQPHFVPPANIEFNHFVPVTLGQTSATSTSTSAAVAIPAGLSQTDSSHVVQPRRPRANRQESDLISETSTDYDAIWSASPSSNRQSTPGTDLSAVSPLNRTLDKALDPFFRLPTVASDREKWLVHFYFREMGHIGFGTHQNSFFCPDRDWVSTYVSAKSQCFQWVLILAEEHLCRLGVLSDQTQMLARKAKAYRSLNSILKSDSVDRDERISGIMYAAIVDNAQSNMHLMALDRLIDETGGFDAFLDGPLGITHPEHIATAYAFGACPITTEKSLNLVKGRFLDTLRAFYLDARVEQQEKLRIRNRRPWDPLARQVIDTNGTLVPTTYDEHLRYYVKAQQESFGSDCLAQLLNTTLNLQADYSSQARHVAALLQTMMIMHIFDKNYLARAMYLKRLKYVSDLSTARVPINGQPRLSHAGLLLISAYVRQEVQLYVDRTKALLKGVMVSKAVVDCLKIVPLLTPASRAQVVSWLRDWLCYNDRFEDSDFGHATEANLATLSAEISHNWHAKDRNHP